MIEIDITYLLDKDVSDFSASRMERGVNVARETWSNAKAEVAVNPLLTTADQVEAARNWFGEFGAWDAETRAAWSEDDVKALLLQYISGHLREIESLCRNSDGSINWQEVDRLSSEGRISGDIYVADCGEHKGRVFFSMV